MFCYAMTLKFYRDAASFSTTWDWLYTHNRQMLELWCLGLNPCKKSCVQNVYAVQHELGCLCDTGKSMVSRHNWLSWLAWHDTHQTPARRVVHILVSGICCGGNWLVLASSSSSLVLPADITAPQLSTVARQTGGSAVAVLIRLL